MSYHKNKKNREGAALLVVLFVVMTITVLSLGFLSRSDVELACGENMILRTQMDYLAESGLEHARGLILNPQEVSGEYWTGQSGQQLVAGSDDYYDVGIERHEPDSGPTYRCNYRITSSAYREKGGEEVGRSGLIAELRLDPCIAFWVGSNTTISSSITINGDVYCDGNLLNRGSIKGDVFASGSITNTGTITGQENEGVGEADVNCPELETSDFSSQYYIGSTAYSVGIIVPGDYNDISLGASGGNPAGIYYCDGDIRLGGNVNITGMLVVKDNLEIMEDGSVTITAVKNFPALLVGYDIKMEGDGAGLSVTGLAKVGHRIDVKNKTGICIDILGALCILDDGIKDVPPGSGSISITIAPAKASLQTWMTPGNPTKWSPAGGAFFKSIERN